MTIEKVIFKNFAAIANALNTNFLAIDFSTMVNKICLLIGPNGSGKTSILSLLHPFSGLGNLDIRDGNNLILEGKNGYKEIHFKKDEDYYIIKHFYTHVKDKSHTVKSYISKNGTELNENGNVTSFKEYVRIELGIELEYLKLIRLGENVTSMIDLTETERKNFMGKMLDEIGVYLTYYKKVNEDLRQLKQMIAHDVDKLNRLGIDDKKIMRNYIEADEALLQEEQAHYNKINGQLSVYIHEIELIPDRDTLHYRTSDAIKSLTKMERVLDKKEGLESQDPQYFEQKLIEADKKYTANTAYITSSDILIKSYLEQLNEAEEQLRSYQVQYQKEEASDKELQKMILHLNNLRKEIRKKKDDIISPPKTSKADLESFITFLNSSAKTLSIAYSYGKEPVKEVIRLLKEKRNVISYVNAHLFDMDENESESSLFIHALEKRFRFTEKEPEFKCDDTSCEARKLWVQVYNLLNVYTEDRKNKKDAEFYRSMESVFRNLQSILSELNTYDTTILSLPTVLKRSFSTQVLFKNLEGCKPLYDTKEMNDYLSVVTEYDNYLKMVAEADTLETDIERYTKLSNLQYVKDQIAMLEYKIDSLRDKIHEKKKSIHDLQEENKALKYSMEYYVDIKEALTKHDMLAKEVEQLTEELNRLIENTKKRDQAERELVQSEEVIKGLQDKIQKMKTALAQYDEIKKELKAYNRVYDEMFLTKEAISSKKGIPLHHIDKYLGKTVDITNDFLDIIYRGRLFIDKFDITPSSFRIPFYNNNVYLSDVKYASQGELSFIKIAISFAMISQAISEYNVMLFDEIDAPLDSLNRENFIKILERHITRVGSEQNFLITHNNMFSSYPVDIIDLNRDKKREDQVYELAHYIPIVLSEEKWVV